MKTNVHEAKERVRELITEIGLSMSAEDRFAFELKLFAMIVNWEWQDMDRTLVPNEHQLMTRIDAQPVQG